MTSHVFGPEHLRDFTLNFHQDRPRTRGKNSNTTNLITFHVHRSILAHHCRYFDTLTHDSKCDTIDLPHPFTVAGYTITSEDIHQFLQHIYDHTNVTLPTIDGDLALSLYFDCQFIRSQCDQLLTTTVKSLGNRNNTQSVSRGRIMHGGYGADDSNVTNTCLGHDLLQHLVRAVRFKLPTLESTCIRYMAQHWIFYVKQHGYGTSHCHTKHTRDELMKLTEWKQLPAETIIQLSTAMIAQAQQQHPIEWSSN